MKTKNETIFLKASIWALILFMCSNTSLSGQILDYQNKVTIVLRDGTPITMYGKARSRDNRFTGDYYYLPTNLRLSQRPDGTPEFLFVKYTTDEKADVGGVQGAIMHFLMEWGLTPRQEAEAQRRLKEKLDELKTADSNFADAAVNPKLLGPVDVYADGDKSFRIISASLSDPAVATVLSSGKAPPIPGAKAAVAAKLDKNTAQLLATTFEKNRSITDVSIELNFKYNVLFPAVDGQIVINWEEVQSYFEKTNAKFTSKGKKKSRDDRFTYDEAKEIYSELLESKAVDVQIDRNTTDDETANKVVESFLEVFLGALSDRDMDGPPSQPSKEEQSENPNIKRGKSYVFNYTKATSRFKRKMEVYNLKYRVAIPKTVPVTGNLGSWYDGVRNNRQCVSSVILNDPFYQHREINLILDLEAEEMFGKEVNYVTVNVRKRRSNGNPFNDAITFDRTSVAKGGTLQSLSYSRGDDSNSEPYEYKAQWGLRGGHIYPENPQWIRGDWQGVNLAPPIKPRLIEFEAPDLDELKSVGITRATLQLRYKKFGKEHHSNVPLTVSKGQPLVEHMIFTDRDQQGYAYRVIVHHREKGRKVLQKWDANINDDYVVVSIPEKLKKNNSFWDKLPKALNNLTGSKESEIKTNTILDKFANVLDVFRDN